MLCSRSDPLDLIQEAVRLHLWANEGCQLTNSFWQHRGHYVIEDDDQD